MESIVYEFSFMVGNEHLAIHYYDFLIIFKFLPLSLFLDSDDNPLGKRPQLLRNSNFKSVMSSIVMTVLRVSVPLLL